MSVGRMTRGDYRRVPSELRRDFSLQCVIVVVALTIVGCSTTGTTTPAPTGTPGVDAPVGTERARQATRSINLSGFPPEYQRGFTDGCAQAGTAAASKPTGVDTQFASGWNDGLAYCRRRPPK